LSDTAGRIARIAGSPLFVAAVLVALAAGAALRLQLPVSNGDIAWHLALGRWMSDHGAIPTSDPFTWTAQGAPMVAHEWLSQWLYWQWTLLTGLDGLRWLHSALGFVTIGLGFLSFRRAGSSPGIALLATVAFIALVEPRFQVRPHMLNPLFGIALYTALFHSRSAWGAGTIVGTTLLTALWANLHSAAALLPALLWIHLGVDLAERRLTGRTSSHGELGGTDPRRAIALASSSTLALLLTPNHVRLLPYLVESGRVNAGTSIEWLPITRFFNSPDHTSFVVAWGLVVIAALAAAVFRLRERRGAAPAVLALVCALAPLQSVRFSWLAFVPIGFAAAELSGWLARRQASTRDAVVTLGALIACGAAVAGLHNQPDTRDAPFWNAGAFPLQSARMLDEVPLQGAVFARPEWGGFLTLRLDERVPIFADGRWVTIGADTVRDAHTMATGRPGALDLLDRWNVGVVVVERDWMQDSPDRDRRDRSWLRCFAAYNSEIWLRRGATGRIDREAFAAYYAEQGVPFDEETGFDPFLAWNASHAWARKHKVRRKHIEHFLPGGKRSERGREVVDWEQRQPTSPAPPPPRPDL